MSKKEHRTIRVPVFDRRAGRRKVIEVTVSVDFRAVADELAQKAFDNKSKVSRECAGAVECKMVKEYEA